MYNQDIFIAVLFAVENPMKARENSPHRSHTHTQAEFYIHFHGFMNFVNPKVRTLNTLKSKQKGKM